MDKISALFQGIENEFKLSTVPTPEDITATRDTNRRGLEDARVQVQNQIDQAFKEIIGYVKFKRASLQSLISLREYIDKELQAIASAPPIKRGGVTI